MFEMFELHKPFKPLKFGVALAPSPSPTVSQSFFFLAAKVVQNRGAKKSRRKLMLPATAIQY